MLRKRYSREQIVTKLRQAEVEFSHGLRTPETCKKLGVSEHMYYRWRKEYGGLRLDQAKRLKALDRAGEHAAEAAGGKPSARQHDFSKRWPRNTSEPAPAARGRGVGATPAGRLEVAGVPGAGPRTDDMPASGRGAGGRAPLGGLSVVIACHLSRENRQLVLHRHLSDLDCVHEPLLL